ncbi:hypothetical protein Cgig2_025649 [Carnegiea gigantea]|uniref:Sulfite exporter TauE/SafE family protein n=1 Tax=Carnegiea gigantea TaxID=171969 RepID=A0A9Q1Q781_9CARY|nr:hypothetical protein Cgig2_025649 [Carnegiea gigantea]
MPILPSGVLTRIIFHDQRTATSMKAFFKGIDTWKKESLLKQAFHEEDKLEESEAKSEEGSSGDYVPICGEPAPTAPSAGAHDNTVPILSNIYWKELFLLLFVWIAFLAVQIIKTQTVTCSLQYWILYALQNLIEMKTIWYISIIRIILVNYEYVVLMKVPIAASVTLFEAVCLYKGKRVLASKGKEVTNWKVHQILFYCFCGIVAGMVGGLLGLGGGFILGPLFLELGIPPQAYILYLQCLSHTPSATSTFSMVFSSSMSVVQYYILKRFPVPYATYFLLVATLAAFVGQHVVRKLIAMLGRASIIVFILATIIFTSAITLGTNSFSFIFPCSPGCFNMIRRHFSQGFLREPVLHGFMLTEFCLTNAGGVGVANMIEKLHNHEYMGFEDLCS